MRLGLAAPGPALMTNFRLQLWSSSSSEGIEIAEIKSETCLTEFLHPIMTGNPQDPARGLTEGIVRVSLQPPMNRRPVGIVSIPQFCRRCECSMT